MKKYVKCTQGSAKRRTKGKTKMTHLPVHLWRLIEKSFYIREIDCDKGEKIEDNRMTKYMNYFVINILYIVTDTVYMTPE